MFEEDFGIRIGPLGFGWGGGRGIRYTRTETTNILRFSIDPQVKKG